MTREQLDIILAKEAKELVKDLQVSSFKIPKWSDLEKQFEPSLHKIWDPSIYPVKLDDNANDDFKRTSLGLQKLAVSRLSQSMFVTPVQRQYDYDKDSESANMAVNILEQVYKTDNFIDSENINRAKKLNASCEIVTIWRVYEKPNIIQAEQAKYKLTHKTYSSQDGYQIFAQVDQYGVLLVVSILYKDTANVEHMEVYINGEKSEFKKYHSLAAGWTLNTEESTTWDYFPVVHTWLPEPVWGGQDGTVLVEQLEEMESYQGLYIKRNALPTFTMDYGELPLGSKKASTTETSSDARRIIVLGKGGKMDDVTWEGAADAVTSRYQRIRNAFFEQIQVPDTSFANMIASNTSAENKELIFADAKAKAKDLGGEWELMFYEELILVKNILSVIFPKYKAEFEQISIRSVVQPYSMRTKKENAEYIANGGSAMSLSTKIKVLGEVDDVQQEIDLINEEQSTQNNNF